MTWIAPEIARDEPPHLADERQMLDGWLNYHRQTLLAKCAGLSADQLRRRAVEPSSMSLLGLVRHMSEVERSWFRRRVCNTDLPYIYVSDEEPDADFDGVDGVDAGADFDIFTAEVRLAREATAALPLDHVFPHPRRAIDMSLRWVYVHMIEEYARHNGHADLLRERIDGRTGD